MDPVSRVGFPAVKVPSSGREPGIPPADQDDRRLLEVSREFEGIFLRQLLRQMRATVPRSDLVQASFGREVFEGMQDDLLAGEMSKSGGIGLAEMLYRQLTWNNRSGPATRANGQGDQPPHVSRPDPPGSPPDDRRASGQ